MIKIQIKSCQRQRRATTQCLLLKCSKHSSQNPAYLLSPSLQPFLAFLRPIQTKNSYRRTSNQVIKNSSKHKTNLKARLSKFHLTACTTSSALLTNTKPQQM